MSAKALKPQDLVVLLKLLVGGEKAPAIAQLAGELGMSASEIHAAFGRAVDAGLARREGKSGIHPVRKALLEFLAHGVRYAFPAKPGTLTRGVPTAWAAEPLAEHFTESGDPPYVWADPGGSARGLEIKPLYPSVPRAAERDPALYQLLALVDAVRVGRARERKRATTELAARIAGG